MAYYNREYRKIKLDNMKYLNSGGCAKVLYDNNIIFKEYYSEIPLSCKLSIKMFHILKEIDNPHFIELLDIYSDFSLTELIKNKLKILPFTLDAYTAKYYPDDSVNVLQEHKDYILDNFRELEILFKIFTDNMICTSDVKRANAILSKNGIIIIDPDLFYMVKYSKQSISIKNKEKLLDLFRSICIASVTKKHYCGKAISLIDNELVNIRLKENIDITHEISKKLKYVKKPIELFKK